MPAFSFGGNALPLKPSVKYGSPSGLAGHFRVRTGDYRIQFSVTPDKLIVERERTALGLTQQQLAKLAGVREETLSRLESGKHSPTVRTVEKIEKALQKAAKKLQRA